VAAWTNSSEVEAKPWNETQAFEAKAISAKQQRPTAARQCGSSSSHVK
jgi:hypothetical protein